MDVCKSDKIIIHVNFKGGFKRGFFDMDKVPYSLTADNPPMYTFINKCYIFLVLSLLL